METARPASSSRRFGLMRSITKVIKFRRSATGGGGGGMGYDGGSVCKLKLPEHFDGSSIFTQSEVNEEDVKLHLRTRVAMENLLARVFASLSAVKAAYAQLQIAQSPYDPDTIQLADGAMVAELKHLSHLKRLYFNKHFDGSNPLSYQILEISHDSQVLAEIQEQRNLIKTFQITAKKLKTDLRGKDGEIIFLKEQLQEAERQNRSLEAKLHPSPSLSDLESLHFSGLNPTHFLQVLRYAVKSIRTFVKHLVSEMEASRWDLGAAAESIAPVVARGKPEDRVFAFESYVCQAMFSWFHHGHFGLRDHDPSFSMDRRRFFEEFLEFQTASLRQLLDHHQHLYRPFGEFCRAKFQYLVHPRMEEAFFGNLDHRELLGSGKGFPGTAFFHSFAEMARRVWTLHRLFFSFEPEAGASIFQVNGGCRFSEVYMESVTAEDDGSGGVPAVGFTVVPGFRVRRTVVQSKVYLARGSERW